MKTVLIVNPVAGARNMTEEVTRAMEQAAQQVGLPREDWQVVCTERKGHGAELARAFAEPGEPVWLFAAGGDGTLNEVIAGAYPYPNAAVGCLPYGSGNDFLRNFGTREEFLDLADQLRGAELVIDLFQTGTGVGAAVCSAGLDAQIAYEIPKFRRLPFCGGEMAYRLAILEQLLHPLGRRLEITVDGVSEQGDCLLAAFANGGWYGGGFNPAPECRMDDGLLDVIWVRKMSLPRIAKVLPVYQRGGHLKNGEVIEELRDVVAFRRGREVSVRLLDDPQKPIIVNVDGECGPANGFSARILPMAGKVILPGKAAARLGLGAPGSGPLH